MKMNEMDMTILIVAFASSACVDPTSESADSGDTKWSSFAADERADSLGPVEGSSRSLAVLRVANESTLATLDHTVSLDVRAAEAIIEHRFGEDGESNSADDRFFTKLADLDDVPWVGPRAFSKMLNFAKSRGYLDEPATCIKGDLPDEEARAERMVFHGSATYPDGTETDIAFALEGEGLSSCFTHESCVVEVDGVAPFYGDLETIGLEKARVQRQGDLFELFFNTPSDLGANECGSKLFTARTFEGETGLHGRFQEYVYTGYSRCAQTDPIRLEFELPRQLCTLR